MKETKRLLLRALFFILTASMAVTEILLVLEGRWADAIPLHLCSVSAVVSAVLALSPRQILLDFLWYLGMPGAVLALLFPAPAFSRFQALLDISYVTTHAFILLIPTCMMVFGMRPRQGMTPVMLMTLLGIAAVAALVNRLLGTDFLFLSAPPAGTPLEWAYAGGQTLYLIALFALMLMLCMTMDALCGRITKK